MLTNKLGLPSGIVRAVENDPYSRGKSDISVTQLIAPAYQRRLMGLHEPQEDVADRIWALLGTSVHHIIERAYRGSGLSEKRLFTEVNGWTVSGQLDVLEDDVLTDFKVTSVWSRDGKIEWEQQLNLLFALCHLNGYAVERLQIVAIYRDWSMMKAGAGDYPASQVGVIPVPKWPVEEAIKFLYQRVEEHQNPEPPPCTDQERWMTPPVFALMKKGNKRAVKLYEDRDEAQKAADEGGKAMYVEARPVSYRRCENYCPVSTVCPVLKQAVTWEE